MNFFRDGEGFTQIFADKKSRFTQINKKWKSNYFRNRMNINLDIRLLKEFLR